jgi:Ca-activated chloride channel family protein
MIQFENIYFLFALLLIPFILVVYWRMKKWRKNALDNFGDIHIITQLFPNISKSKRTWKLVLLLISFVFLTIAIVNPQIGTKLKESKQVGADLVICLDVSNSMKAEDFQPNRLEKAKMAIIKLIDKLNGDRIGLIVFAGDAFVQLPVTTDYSAAKLFIENINTDIVATQGTAIGKAIAMAVESFGKDEGKNKAILVITDGENHEDDAIAQAEDAKNKGITVHTIGIGSVNGSPIPLYKGDINVGFRKDKEGNTIITKLNETVLQEVAMAGNGVYVKASNSDLGMGKILEEISKLEKKQFKNKMYSDYEDRFQWFLLPAFLLLIVELLISERKTTFIDRLKLFNERK